ncbi:MAG TPA: hypothetical protein VFX28_18505, partial [Methylomirabilota bacterium]|nr:hypothetical protein [Methylomirabilota bacterium]
MGFKAAFIMRSRPIVLQVSLLMLRPHSEPAPWAVLTGDTLFVGDVGRVDILSSRLPVTELAGLMYDSLHGKLLKLPDD